MAWSEEASPSYKMNYLGELQTGLRECCPKNRKLNAWYRTIYASIWSGTHSTASVLRGDEIVLIDPNYLKTSGVSRILMKYGLSEHEYNCVEQLHFMFVARCCFMQHVSGYIRRRRRAWVFQYTHTLYVARCWFKNQQRGRYDLSPYKDSNGYQGPTIWNKQEYYIMPL